MTVEIEAYCYDERMSDDGVEAEAIHEERRKYSRLILFVICTGIGW